MLTAGLGLGVLAGPAALAHTALGAEPGGEPPAWATFSDAELAADLDGDGIDESIELRDRRLVVRDGRASGAGAAGDVPVGVADARAEGDADDASGGPAGAMAEGGIGTGIGVSDGAPVGVAGAGNVSGETPDAAAASAPAGGRDAHAGVDGDAGAAGDGVLLETPEDWQVSDVFAADFDGDGALEVVFLLWRHGNFGSSRPFWLSAKGDGGATSEEPLTQHLFMYRWRADRMAPVGSADRDAGGRSAGRLYPVWMSSRLGVEAARIEMEPAPPSSVRRPRLRIMSADRGVTLWEWLSWGFALVEDEGPTGAGGGDGSLSLLVVGDVIAHPNIYEGAYDAAIRSFDFAPLFDHVRGRIGASDLAAVCQETVLVENPARRSGYPLFATPQSLGDALVDAGFGIVLGATNHVNDQGPAGIDETTAFWAREHPEVTLLGLHAEPDAAGGPAYVERNGIRLALFDYTYGLNGRDLGEEDAHRVDVLDESGETHLLADVAVAREQADLVICFLHIGEEYDPEPTKYQRDLIERLIDAGAGAVVCSHTHVLGPYGRMRTEAGGEGIVFYGLGNFVSGQADDIRTILGGAAALRIERTVAAGEGVGGADASEDAPISVARVASFELEPLVCHTSATDGSVAAYFLDDYSDELAADHVLGNLTGVPLTMANLRAHVPEELS
ncbi:MAG: CapA family protein [Coriobacteriia bacterium]|nr:CapA family protein [Coriobacteriia bacterium]